MYCVYMLHVLPALSSSGRRPSSSVIAGHFYAHAYPSLTLLLRDPIFHFLLLHYAEQGPVHSLSLSRTEEDDEGHEDGGGGVHLQVEEALH